MGLKHGVVAGGSSDMCADGQAQAALQLSRCFSTDPTLLTVCAMQLTATCGSYPARMLNRPHRFGHVSWSATLQPAHRVVVVTGHMLHTAGAALGTGAGAAGHQLQCTAQQLGEQRCGLRCDACEKDELMQCMQSCSVMVTWYET